MSFNKEVYTIHKQASISNSPWNTSTRIKMLFWEYIWLFLCSWTPKPANFWRLFWLKLFGAKINGNPFVHQRARVHIPWNIILHENVAIGDRANLYSLANIEIQPYAVVAQESYLCTGSHAFNATAKNLVTAPIVIGSHAFIGARAFILPGLNIGDHAIVGACSVVTKSVEANTTVAGNPARQVALQGTTLSY